MLAYVFNSQGAVFPHDGEAGRKRSGAPVEGPDPRVERVILICWVLIAIKHVAVIWAVHHYTIPFHQLWVNAPTWLLAAVATAVYYYSHRRA